jgi:hypothetical protein
MISLFTRSVAGTAIDKLWGAASPLSVVTLYQIIMIIIIISLGIRIETLNSSLYTLVVILC